MPDTFESFDESPTVWMQFCSIDATTAGEIGVKIGWATQGNEPNIANKCFQYPCARQNRTDNHEILQQWYNDQVLDLMDPDAGFLLNTIEQQRASNSLVVQNNEGGQFAFNEHLSAFCLEPIELNAKNKTPKAELDEKVNVFESIDWMDLIDLQRHKGKKYLKHIYQLLSNHCDTLNKDNEAQDLINDESMPTFRSLFETVLQLFRPARPLNPQHKRRQFSTMTRAISFKPSQSFNIIVNVLRASGVPCRQLDAQQMLSARRTSTLSSIVQGECMLTKTAYLLDIFLFSAFFL